VDNLRLILFISGILVIAAIYVWEILRGRRTNAREPSAPQPYKEPDTFYDTPLYDTPPSLDDPLLDGNVPNNALSDDHIPNNAPSPSPFPKDEPHTLKSEPHIRKDEPHAETETQYWDRVDKAIDDTSDEKVVLGDLNTLHNSDTKTDSPVAAPDDLPTISMEKEKTDIPVEPTAMWLGAGEHRSPMERLRIKSSIERFDIRSFVGKLGIKRTRTRTRAEKVGPERGSAKKGSGAKDLFITLTIIAKPGRPFTGSEIREQFEKVGLRFGHMQIFHHFGMATDQENERPVFSVADILEPGIFHPDEMENHTTKGLVLFMQLPGPLDGLVAFELMSSVAQQLAKSLGGELCDDTRSTLTTQSANHLRERIEELKRKQLV